MKYTARLMRLFDRFRSAKRPEGLIILDDIFPHLLSSFRIAEFNAYLSAHDSAVVYSTAAAFPAIKETRSFDEVCNEYNAAFPQLSGRTFRYDARQKLEADLTYFVFLQNARAFGAQLERSDAPFVFTLYPGGGFQLAEPESDAMLRKVCGLRNLAKVITTQKISHDYLLNFLAPDKVEFIYGGVFPSNRLLSRSTTRKHYLQDKPTFDICFVAYKYMRQGKDKGYDVVIDVARELCRRHPDINFHIVGPFTEDDIDVSELSGRIKFYGSRPTDFFGEFYAGMDLILAPNAPFVLMPGAFDGFPTGSCIEAALCGVAVFCTDVLKQNVAFKPDEEVVIVSRNVSDICATIEGYYQDYDKLTLLAQRGQKAFAQAFAIEEQLQKRFRILSPYLS